MVPSTSFNAVYDVSGNFGHGSDNGIFEKWMMSAWMERGVETVRRRWYNRLGCYTSVEEKGDAINARVSPEIRSF